MSFDRLRRRDFVRLLGSAAAGWPLAAQAQQQRRVGVLMGAIEHDPRSEQRVALLEDELSTRGWKAGVSLRIDYRWTGNETERMQSSAQDLATLSPDVIVVTSARALEFQRRATSTIPIVFVGTNDPVGQGIVPSLARPGGNITGFTVFELSVIGKMLELLKRLAPGVASVGLVSSADNPNTPAYLRFFRSVTPPFAVLPVAATVDNDAAGMERAIADVARQPGSGLLLPPDIAAGIHRELIAATAAKLRLPAISADPLYVPAGGLISYGPEEGDIFRRAGGYVDRILRGEKPGDLPVQAPVKFEMAINLKAARALGLDPSPDHIALADKVIE
jgi:putative ABC transport system substrate-binding protein